MVEAPKTKKWVSPFPRVYKMGGLLQVVYADHTEIYEFKSSHNDNTEDDHGKESFNPFTEIDMIKGNGGREIHMSEKKEEDEPLLERLET